jgi:uncharacterized protein YabN with tetrapyrrole methylase and pyrophosphatase domain
LSLAEALLELQELTERLRRDCPWDREQTAKTIVPHTVEEAYEVADAALAGDDAKLLDELGDLLFQSYFLALLLSERGAGDLEDVARRVHAKLVSRHPHVFGGPADEVDSGGVVRERRRSHGQSPHDLGTAPPSRRLREARTAGDVRENWERLKTAEEGREGIFHDVPGSLPGLLYARKVQLRARSAGFEYPDVAGALADLESELAELRAELGEEPAPETEPDPRHFEELGDVLFAAVNVARRLNVDPELALRSATDRFRARVERAEALAAERDENWAELPLAEQDRYFDLAKEAGL